MMETNIEYPENYIEFLIKYSFNEHNIRLISILRVIQMAHHYFDVSRNEDKIFDNQNWKEFLFNNAYDLSDKPTPLITITRVLNMLDLFHWAGTWHRNITSDTLRHLYGLKPIESEKTNNQHINMDDTEITTTLGNLIKVWNYKFKSIDVISVTETDEGLEIKGRLLKND